MLDGTGNSLISPSSLEPDVAGISLDDFHLADIRDFCPPTGFNTDFPPFPGDGLDSGSQGGPSSLLHIEEEAKTVAISDGNEPIFAKSDDLEIFPYFCSDIGVAGGGLSHIDIIPQSPDALSVTQVPPILAATEFGRIPLSFSSNIEPNFANSMDLEIFPNNFVVSGTPNDGLSLIDVFPVSHDSLCVFKTHNTLTATEVCGTNWINSSEIEQNFTMSMDIEVFIPKFPISCISSVINGISHNDLSKKNIEEQ